MTEHDRILDAFRNCITEPKCKDCPWTECEELDNRKIKIPADLALAVMRELVAQKANSACTKERCPVNASAISDDCNIETCPWRTEALIPRPSMSGLWYECPVCGRHLTKELDNYCARCGRRVKWE